MGRLVKVCLVNVGLVMAASGAAACSGSRSASTGAAMTVTPAGALSDSPLTVSLRGFHGQAQITISLNATDYKGVRWSAEAAYKVPAGGNMTLSRPALSGSYTGVDPMGLVLSMLPATGGSSPVAFQSPAAGASFTFTARSGRTVLATATTLRRNRYDQARVRELRPSTDGVFGNIYTPEHMSGKRPGVLVFGGSEGGIFGGELEGAALAAHGYPTLGLAYFGEPGLPSNLVNIPLDYFEKAVKILRAQPGVDPHHVLVFGVSRGGEAAMLLGATYPSLIDGVIAGVPSSEALGGSWTLRGHPVPAGVIAVNRINGPILENCGGQDTIWSSCTYVDEINATLKAHHFRFPVTTLRFPQAGHIVGNMSCCYSATSAYYAQFGGTPRADSDAQLTGSQALLAFLAKQ